MKDGERVVVSIQKSHMRHAGNPSGDGEWSRRDYPKLFNVQSATLTVAQISKVIENLTPAISSMDSLISYRAVQNIDEDECPELVEERIIVPPPRLPSVSKLPLTILTGILGAGVKMSLMSRVRKIYASTLHSEHHWSVEAAREPGRRIKWTWLVVFCSLTHLKVRGVWLSWRLNYNRAGRMRWCFLTRSPPGTTTVDKHAILSSPETPWTSLPNGCLCCTMKTESLSQLEYMIQTSPKPVSHVVIEMSGSSDVRRVVGELWLEPGMFSLDGVVGVVDGRLRSLEDVPAELRDIWQLQLGCCDLVVVSKCDLIKEEQCDAVKHLIRSINSAALIETCSHGDIPFDKIFGLCAYTHFTSSATPEVISARKVQMELYRSTHHHHHPSIVTVCVTFPHQVTEERLRYFLSAIHWDKVLPGTSASISLLRFKVSHFSFCDFVDLIPTWNIFSMQKLPSAFFFFNY